jgi:hypothetical protein
MAIAKNQSPATVQPEENTQELLEIGELQRKHKISRAVFAGVCSANGWKPGKLIAMEEFLAAVAKFTEAPINGKPHSRKEKEANK